MDAICIIYSREVANIDFHCVMRCLKRAYWLPLCSISIQELYDGLDETSSDVELSRLYDLSLLDSWLTQMRFNTRGIVYMFHVRFLLLLFCMDFI
ncbi:protein OBERON 3 [Iris pallida]|uniref:Protein OBERON 3 n=1 Tax=Iris pallida TaxID=29817 RepID=A0AAX6GLV3_IRIPA|nr:protein OBERON 3 [Iris pallida]